jgi:hypothetical protein
MEVHAHAHPAPSGTGTTRKKWSHYFWEFLMLFLAVIAGFYAENIREHKVEAKRGKEYIRSFLADLKTDTSTFNLLDEEYAEKIKELSGNYDCYKTIKKGEDFNQCLVKLIKASFSFTDLIVADRTLQQLKSSGALRLIPKIDADSITIYDAQTREHLQGERTGVQEAQTLLRAAYMELLNYDAVYHGVYVAGEKTLDPQSPLLRTSDISKIDRLFSIIERYTDLIKSQLFRIKALNKRALSLINYFSDKYHFKE